MTWTMLPYLFLPAMEFIFEEYDTGEFFIETPCINTLSSNSLKKVMLHFPAQ